MGSFLCRSTFKCSASYSKIARSCCSSRASNLALRGIISRSRRMCGMRSARIAIVFPEDTRGKLTWLSYQTWKSYILTNNTAWRSQSEVKKLSCKHCLHTSLLHMKLLTGLFLVECRLKSHRRCPAYYSNIFDSSYKLVAQNEPLTHQ